jgi:RNA polymerase-binding transcription factor DksA
MVDVSKYEAQLRKRLAYLSGRLDNIEDRLDEQPNPDWDENAAEHEEDEVLEDLGNMGLDEIRGINAALKRIQAGSYGECVKCGGEISAERLDVIPQAPFCKDCA